MSQNSAEQRILDLCGAILDSEAELNHNERMNETELAENEAAMNVLGCRMCRHVASDVYALKQHIDVSHPEVIVQCCT